MPVTKGISQTCFLLCAAANLAACARNLPAVPLAAFTGSFAVGDDAGCVLQSTSVGDDSVRVQLSCTRGAPSYNLGFLDERLRVVDGRSVFVTREFGGDCQITFEFFGDRVRLDQVGEPGACGFGYGVFASGEPRRVSSAVPPFDLNPAGSRPPP